MLINKVCFFSAHITYFISRLWLIPISKNVNYNQRMEMPHQSAWANKKMQSNSCPLNLKESAKKVLRETMLAFIQKYKPGHVANVCDYAQAYRTYVLVIAGANRTNADSAACWLSWWKTAFSSLVVRWKPRFTIENTSKNRQNARCSMKIFQNSISMSRCLALK